MLPLAHPMTISDLPNTSMHYFPHKTQMWPWNSPPIVFMQAASMISAGLWGDIYVTADSSQTWPNSSILFFWQLVRHKVLISNLEIIVFLFSHGSFRSQVERDCRMDGRETCLILQLYIQWPDANSAYWQGIQPSVLSLNSSESHFPQGSRPGPSSVRIWVRMCWCVFGGDKGATRNWWVGSENGKAGKEGEMKK